MSAPKQKRQSKDAVTRIHQWVTLAGIPIGLAIAGWVATSFDAMRLDLVALKTTMGFVQQDIGRHTTELEEIQKSLAAKH